MAPPTAYMLFCNENREAARQKLAAEGHEKVAVTVVAKELGQLWKALSEEQKAAYKARAEEQLQQFKEQQQQQGADGNVEQDPEQQQADDSGKAPATAAVPASWVRKVVAQDPEIRRCTAQAIQALSTVADVFLAAVCSKATAAAAGAKRRTVRLEDVERCVRTDRRLVGAGMTTVLAMVNAAVAASAAAAAEEGKGAPPGKKPRLEKAVTAKNHNSIERAFGLAQ